MFVCNACNRAADPLSESLAMVGKLGFDFFFKENNPPVFFVFSDETCAAQTELRILKQTTVEDSRAHQLLAAQKVDRRCCLIGSLRWK